MSKTQNETLKKTVIPEEVVINKIYLIRDQKVMLDSDLADLYAVETKQLKRQVKRNIERSPDDFMFELTSEEYHILRSQIGTLKRGEHSKYPPMVFSEQGVAMLSSVINSTRAVQVNIRIMRIFNQLRTAILSKTNIRLEIERIKRSLDNRDKNIELVFQYLDELNEKIKRPPLLPDREMVGYKIGKNSNKR